MLLYFPQIRDIRPSAQIEDLNLLKDIAGRCGYKVRTVAPPSDEVIQEVVSTKNGIAKQIPFACFVCFCFSLHVM